MPKTLSSRLQQASAVLCVLLTACTAVNDPTPTTTTETTLAAPVSGGSSPDAPDATTPIAEASAPSTVSVGADGGSSSTGKPPNRPMPYRGVNLNGADFGSALPGRYGSDYTFPTTSEIDYYVAKGMNLFRIGFAWERLQPAAYGGFDAAYAERLYSLVSYASSKGAHVVLNPQNFARYYGNVVGSSAVPDAAFADFWGKLSARWKSDSNVMFNLVNEPHAMATEQWVAAANAAIVAIRAEGATNTIVVPGNGWTGAWTWNDSSYGTPNAVAMLNIVDSQENILFEAHQYLDAGGGGQSGACVDSTIGADRLVGFVTWLRAHHLKGMLGEFGGGNNATCSAAIHGMLSYLMASSDVLVGWSWWGGGPWWPSNYPFLLDPTGTKDAPQMAWLTPFL